MKDVGLITIHGMGKTKVNYYDDLEEKLKKKLKSNWTRVSFQNVQYAPYLQDPQNALWRKMVAESDNDLDSTKIRQFFLYGFGDAGSLEYSAYHDHVKYLEVQREVQKAIDRVYLDFQEDKTKPIVIIAQSLGCQVISNYLWDAQNGRHIFENGDSTDQNRSNFRKLKSLKHLITTGCNIPLFVSGLEQRKCFSLPNEDFQWDNYYDPQDVLGWPLAQLDSSYEIVNDHHIDVGGIFTGWNPASHSAYWKDQDIVTPLVNILKSKL